MKIDVEKIIREYIDKSIHMSLATVRDNRPWVCEVHFVYDDNLNLYFRSLKTRRHSMEIANNPNVAGNIVKQHSLEEYPHAIYFEGTADILNNKTEQEKIFSKFHSRLNASKEIIDEAQKDDGHKFYKITIDNWYAFGKFGGDKAQKHQLIWNGGKK